MKGYTVFNVEQIDSLPGHYTATQPPRLNPEQRIAQAEGLFAATGADIRHGGTAFSMLPVPTSCRCRPSSFRDVGAYYATLAHECTTGTRHGSRLDRDFGANVFGDQGYAMEELVAAFLCADLELTRRSGTTCPYITGWLQTLKNDKRAIVTAARHAQKAADFVHSVGSPSGS